jgi:DNA invertase Pin-like site-specific DNA recombinase
MKVIGYAGVSTIGQAKDGLGIPTQERMIRAWAKANKHRLVRIVQENGKSGSLPDSQRPGLLDALTSIRSRGGKREADAIVVTSLDRLARNLHVQEAVLGKAWALGGKVFSVDSGEILRDDPDDPMRTAMRQMVGVFAQLDRAMVIKRLRNGRITKASRGEHAFGFAPYGWRVGADDRLEPDPEEQKAVKLAKKLHRQKQSLRQIAQALDDSGYKPRRAPAGPRKEFALCWLRKRGRERTVRRPSIKRGNQPHASPRRNELVVGPTSLLSTGQDLLAR